jgi:hypothetical protein
MNRFDRILWRINGILFLGILLYSAWTIWLTTHLYPPTPPYRAKQPASHATAQPVAQIEGLHLTFSFPIKGTPFTRIALERESESGKFSGPYQLRECYNYLYLNTSDLSSWWLFERNDRLITGVHDLRAEGDGGDKPIIATIWEVVTGDTDGDHRLTQNDREAIFFCGADGKKPVEIIPPTDGLEFIQQVPPGQVLIVYRREPTIVVAALFSVADGSKIKESVLPMKDN